MVVVFVSARRHHTLHPVDTYPPKVEDDVVLRSIRDPQMLMGLGRISSLDADWTGPYAPLVTNKRPWLWMSVSTTVTARLKQQAPTALKGTKPHRMEVELKCQVDQGASEPLHNGQIAGCRALKTSRTSKPGAVRLEPTPAGGSRPPRRVTGATLCGYHHQPQHYWCCATLITTITAPPKSDVIQKLT
ncbi:hypothetical protein GE21DRAFT_1754 [Neurospora crassa]|uniref:Uncharacterized protein n=1 Tax=Neurospora crassa (strain ATCC 24698 / 74-OR23-1A / CBS 708.71 / DSM 1257 / FGSC 987) TaxID=367110 RepID=Q7SFA7_NEUCR|nr:hypothetical protein NCU00940 [Neurospora crassa OR74A]EAA35530.1 hypothetical protein NCU00940 [Neurospora crassa OR74A]KHE81788.1 hypothetical protein GE21DRAFT_1754 [Neurospora crassa]|eukprot:XP_964766.1 hypothetical protein NCU00940 [Neurospora crassa OR74A]